MQPEEVLISPLLTESSQRLSEKLGVVVFRVRPTASKHQIREAIKVLYGVQAAQIRTMRMAGKKKRRGSNIGFRSNWKKALITLSEGQTIDFYAAE